MKLCVVLLALPLVMVFAAEKPAPKKTKAPAKAESASTPAKQAPRIVIPPGFGPRVGAAQSQPAPAASPAPKADAKPSGWIKPAANPAPAMTIPAGAEEISTNVFRHTDAKGTAWLYSKTPFGVSKVREDEASKEQTKPRSPFGVSRAEEKSSAPPAAPAETGMDVKAKDLGDRIQFERVTPFGASRWERSKSELTEEERAIWEREQKKP